MKTTIGNEIIGPTLANGDGRILISEDKLLQKSTIAIGQLSILNVFVRQPATKAFRNHAGPSGF